MAEAGRSTIRIADLLRMSSGLQVAWGTSEAKSWA
jgi:hypothetical protein